MNMSESNARKNMVDGQLEPNGIISAELLDHYRFVPRHLFFPKESAAQAYSDKECALGSGRFALPPLIEAQMIQAVDPKKNDIGLVVTCGGWSSAAMLSYFVQTVFMQEQTAAQAKKAEAAFIAQGACNIVCFHTKADAHAPFDCIVFAGACTHVPQHLFDQLRDGGRMVIPVKPHASAPAELILFHKQDGVVAQRVIAQVNVPFMKGMEAEEAFAL